MAPLPWDVILDGGDLDDLLNPALSGLRMGSATLGRGAGGLFETLLVTSGLLRYSSVVGANVTDGASSDVLGCDSERGGEEFPAYIFAGDEFREGGPPELSAGSARRLRGGRIVFALLPRHRHIALCVNKYHGTNSAWY